MTMRLLWRLGCGTLMTGMVFIAQSGRGQNYYHSLRSAPPATEGPQNTNQISEGLKPLLDKLVSADTFSGVVAVSKNGNLLFAQAYGLADQSTRTPVTLDTKFVIASVTQTFTAVAVSQLVEQGKLSFSKPLSEYLPNYPSETAKQLTIHQLLTHTGGVSSVARSKAFRQAPTNFKTLKDYLTFVESQPLTRSDHNYEYTDGDCVVLGALIEQVSGQSYYDYVRTHLFRITQMNDTGFDLLPRPTKMAIGYTSRDLGEVSLSSSKGMHDNQAILPTKAGPGFGAYSTAGDLLHYGQALLQHRLLSESGTESVLSGKVDTGETGAHQRYAYGFFDGQVGTTRVVNHGGTGPGIDVGFDLYPQLGYVVVIMSNYDPPAAQQIRDELRLRIAAQTQPPK